MDAVQRAYESQLRREERKRLQLQNSIMLEEDKRRRELEKNEKERVRQHMIAAQQLQRMQGHQLSPGAPLEAEQEASLAYTGPGVIVNLEQFSEYQRQERARKAATELHTHNMLLLEAGNGTPDKQMEDTMRKRYNSFAHNGVSAESPMDEATRQVEARHMQMFFKEQSYGLQQTNTDFLKHQVMLMAKSRSESKDDHRAMIYQRAREEEAMKCEYHQRKIAEAEEKSRYAQWQKEQNLAMQKEALQMRSADIHRKVKNRETEVMMYRQQQEEQYESKLERANRLEQEKKQMLEEMKARQRSLAQDESLFKSALLDIRNSKSIDDVSVLRRLPAPDMNAPRLEFHPSPYPPKSPVAQRPRPTSAPRRPVSGSQTARMSMQDTYNGRAVTPGRPKSARGPVGQRASAMEQELENKVQDEQKRERERESILRQVSDPRQRARLHKLFAIERQQAKQVILRLQMNV